jgi:hypothetical protein
VFELKTRVRMEITNWADRQVAYEELRALGKQPKIILVHGHSFLEWTVNQLVM